MSVADDNDVDRDLVHLLIEQSIGHGVILLDPQCRVTYWSPGAARLLGEEQKQALGQPFSKIFTPEDLERGIDRLEIAVATSDATAEDDRWHVRADGSRLWVTGSLTALRNNHGKLLGYGKIFRDRTNLREQIELLTRQLDAARRESVNQSVVSATLSHELRNLLAALVHGMKLLRAASTDQPRREALGILMEEQLELVSRLTERVLEAQRLKTGKVTLQASTVELQEVLRKTVATLEQRVLSKQLQLELIEPETPLLVEGDPVRLFQVFTNLVENAVKYTPKGGRIWIKATIEDPEAVVTVEDTGAGIPPAMLTQIFELFTQVDAEASQSGLGIGLAVVKDIVSLHGGSVQARSQGVGRGSEFSVRLPLQRHEKST